MSQLLVFTGASSPAYAAADPMAYVVNLFGVPNSLDNRGSLVPLDLKTGATQTPIPLGTNPYAVALSPDGTTAWVTIRADGTVIPVDLATGTAGTPVNVGAESTPLGIVTLTANSVPLAYVATGGTVGTNPTGAITVINLTTQAVVATITSSSASNPFDVAVSPDGSTVWATYQNGYVAAISTATNTITKVTHLDSGVTESDGTFVAPDLNAMTLSPDGSVLYAADYANSSVYSMVTSTATPSTVYSAVASEVDSMVATSSFLYMAESAGGAVATIDLSTGNTGLLYLNGTGTYGPNDYQIQPAGIMLSPGHTTAYVMDEGTNQVVPITLSPTSPSGGTIGTPISSTGFSGPRTMILASKTDPEASLSTITSDQSVVPAGGAVTAKLTVTLSNGVEPLAGDTVAVTGNSGSNALVSQYGTDVTDANGEVQFLTSDTSAEKVTYTAKDTTTGVTLSPTVTVSFTSSTAQASVTVGTPSANPATVGVPVTFTASVSGSSGTPTGTVTFVQDGNAISGCTLLPISGGNATCQYTYSSTVGSPHTVTANYSGDTTYGLARSSNSISEAVALAASSITLSTSENPATVGDQVQYTASVTGSGSPVTGAVQIYDGTNQIQSCADISQSSDACQVTVSYDTPTDGQDHQISATYDGDTTHLQAGSNTIDESVQATPVSYGADYVALGDSYSAGEGNSPYSYGSQNTHCDRSSSAYGPLLDSSQNLGTMAFVACSGAVTDDLFNPNVANGQQAQLCGAPGATACNPGTTPWLGPNTKVVSLTIGGNDAGFSTVLEQCIKGRYLIFTVGSSKCLQDKTLATQIKQRFGALIGQGTATTPAPDNRPIHSIPAVLAAIHAAAPNAHVYVAGYPAPLGRFGGSCKVGNLYLFNVPIISQISVDAVVSSRDASDIDTLAGQLDQAIQSITQQMGPWATYVNAPANFQGHGFCDTYTNSRPRSTAPWLFPVAANVDFHDMTKPSYAQPGSFHPTATGQQLGFEKAFVSAGA